MRYARQRRQRTQTLTSKFLGALDSVIIYKSNIKNTLFYCRHTVLKIETAGKSEASFISTIHYVVSKHRITSPKSMYGCIIAGNLTFSSKSSVYV